MPKDPKLAQSQIEVALFQSRKLVPPEAVDAMPVIGIGVAWAKMGASYDFGIADHHRAIFKLC